MVTFNATAESLSTAGIFKWTRPDISIASALKTFCIAFLSLFSTTTVLPARNILLTNDDGWAVAQIRAQFNAFAADPAVNVRRAAHGCRLVAEFLRISAGRAVCARSEQPIFQDVAAESTDGAVRVQLVPNRFSC